jgi:hypothetical protein
LEAAVANEATNEDKETDYKKSAQEHQDAAKLYTKAARMQKRKSEVLQNDPNSTKADVTTAENEAKKQYVNSACQLEAKAKDHIEAAKLSEADAANLAAQGDDAYDTEYEEAANQRDAAASAYKSAARKYGKKRANIPNDETKMTNEAKKEEKNADKDRDAAEK